MQISSNIENNLAKAINNVTVPKKSRSYELCVKADALRFAKSYRESVKFYLDSIMMDRSLLGLSCFLQILNWIQKSYKNAGKIDRVRWKQW